MRGIQFRDLDRPGGDVRKEDQGKGFYIVVHDIYPLCLLLFTATKHLKYVVHYLSRTD